MSIHDKFSRLCSNLRMSSSAVSLLQSRYHQITQRLNADSYGLNSDARNTLYFGSYGRGTAIHVSDGPSFLSSSFPLLLTR